MPDTVAFTGLLLLIHFTHPHHPSPPIYADPEILVQFSSEPLRLALKDLIAKDVPEIYEEDPEVSRQRLESFLWLAFNLLITNAPTT